MRGRPETPGAPAPDELADLPVARLAECCVAETQRYYQAADADGRYGYQLFRRAFVERDPAAWEAVAAVYGPLFARWARTHRLFGQTDEEAEAFANQALAQLWRRIEPARFEAFPTLASLLRYAQRCIHHLVIDQARTGLRERARAAACGRALLERGQPTPQGLALARAQAGEVWALVRAHCRGEREERLAYGSLVLGLPPRDLLAVDPTTFDSVATINAGLSTLRRRLQRSPALRGRYRALAGD